MAQLVLAAAGAAIGSLAGPMGTSVGWALGSALGGSLSAPDQQGPRIADRTVQVASYGSAVARVYGSGRLAGTLIWSTDIIEAASTESAKGGPEVTSYSYSVSCAVAICEGVIGSVRRIWADAKLVYDISDGASGETQAASSAFAEFMTIYTGTEAQLPDPTIESIEGAGEVEAFRGTAYVVFDGLPLADYGNRIPNFMFEVSTNEEATNPAEFLANYELEPWKLYDVDGARTAIPQHHNDAIDLDVEYVAQGSGTTYSGLSDAVAALGDGYTEFVGYYTSEENLLSAFPGGAIAGDARYVYLAYNKVQPQSIVGDGLGAGLTDQELCAPFACQPGKVIMASSFYPIIGTASQGHTGVGIMLPYGSDPSPWDTPDVGNAGCLSCTPDGTGHFPLVRIVANKFVRAERKLTIPGQRCYPGTPSVLRNAQLPGNPSFCLNNIGEVSHNVAYTGESNTFKQLRSLSQNTISVGRYPMGPVLRLGDPNYNNMDYWDAQAALAGITADYPYEVTGAAAGTATPREVEAGSVLLSEIVSDLCTLAGLTSEQIDVTALTDVALGFTRGRVMAARSAIEVLRSAFYFDAVESGDKIRFVKRGAAPMATLTLDDVGAGLDAATEPLEHDRAQEAELPSSVVVAYQSPAIDFQTGVQQARRRVGGSQQINQVELPIVMTDLKAAEVADVLLYDSWASRTRRKFSVGMALAYLEPTDIVAVDDGAAVYELRIVDKTEDSGVITFDCRDNDVASYYPNSTPALPSGGGSAVRFYGPTKLYLLDIPILSDANDDPGYYMAATGYLSGWRGAEVFRSANAGASYTSVRDATARVIAGQADTVLGDYAGGNTVDEINSVDVTVLFGELSSITRAQLLNNGNAAMVGDELIQFQRATLQSGSTYRLTGLLRGRKGTERHMAAHVVGERFVLLSASTVYRISASQTQIDEASVWKGVTFGSGLSDAYEVDFTNTAVGLMPLAPVGLFAAPVGGQYVAQWVRRTRYDATWRPLVDAPVGETTESYQIDVYTAAGALVNTLSSTTPSVTFGSPEKDLMYEVGLIWPGNYAGDLYAAEYTINAEARFLRMAADGSIDVATAPFAGHVWRVVYDGAGAAYLITSETDVSDTFVTAIVLYRVDLATMAVTASFDLFAAVSQAGYEIVHDGTDLWSVTITGATLRKHNPTTLAITGTHVLTNTGTRTTNLAHDGAGTFFIGCKDWTRIIAYQPATTTTVWDIDFAASAGAIESIWFVNGMLFITGTLNTVAVDPATGAVVQSHSEVSAGPIVAYGPYAAYVELIATASPGRVDYTLGDVRLLETTGGTFVRSQAIDGDSLALVGTDDGDLLVTAYGIGVEVAYRYSAPADLAGGRIDVYQMSSVLGRGYPATFTL